MEVAALTPFSARSRVSTGRSNRSHLFEPSPQNPAHQPASQPPSALSSRAPSRAPTAGGQGAQAEWFGSLRERKAAEKRRARAAVGLVPEGEVINERDKMEVSLGYRDKMQRSELLGHRKASLLEGMESGRVRAEEAFVPQLGRLKVREDAEHMWRESGMATSRAELERSSLKRIRHVNREGNRTDLEDKWQSRVDAKLPIDPNLYQSPGDRPPFWASKPNYTDRPSFSSRSSLLEARRAAVGEGLRASFPHAGVTVPKQTRMWAPVDRLRWWDSGP